MAASIHVSTRFYFGPAEAKQADANHTDTNKAYLFMCLSFEH